MTRDPLLAARARESLRAWRRAGRRIRRSRWWSPAERALALLPHDDEAPSVALGAELDELTELHSLFDRARHGEREARDALIDRLASGEHLTALMPHGRLPRDPLPRARKILAAMQRHLVSRLAIQRAAASPRPPARARGVLSLSLALTPSWGASSRALTLGGARWLLAGDEPLPARARFSWDRRGWTLDAGRTRVRAAWGDAPRLARAGGRTLSALPCAGAWPILPPIVDEDGRSSRREIARCPSPDRPRFAARFAAFAAERAREIQLAHAVLRAAWPEGAAAVGRYTRAIIPVAQSQVVSYSFAAAPGWSYLNLFDRDFVDRIDDLAHENAHHELNHAIARAPLYRPLADEPLLYYSPWREALRPLRGILHSVFTFAVAARLFSHLHRALAAGRPLPRDFSPAERRKIAARCLEELAMVRYSLEDLAHARARGRLTTAGAALVPRIARAIRRDAALARSLRRALAGTRALARIARLERTLAAQRALSLRLG